MTDERDRNTEAFRDELQMWREWRGTVTEAFRHLEETIRCFYEDFRGVYEALSKKADRSDLDACFDKLDRCRDRCEKLARGQASLTDLRDVARETGNNTAKLEGMKVKLLLFGAIGGAGFAGLAYVIKLFIDHLKGF
jgi:hypothetical protein